MKEEVWRDFYKNGELKEECPMKYGKLHGIATLYDEEGNIKEKRVYENDILMGNPFKGATPEKIATRLGVFVGEYEEWKIAEKEESEEIEIDEKIASIILFEKNKK